ncbi:MAG: hypothetical protein R3C19_10950 [Planctomycetaceae bacterium]
MNTERVRIIRRVDNALVDAELLDNLEASDLLLVERQWEATRHTVHQKLLMAGISRRKWPESLHWNWCSKSAQLKQLAVRGFGITMGGHWQAVCLTDCVSYTCRKPDNLGKPLVYLDFIEVAPWNWTIDEIGQTAEFGACGPILFDRVEQQSREEGFKGRIGLHALPQAERFYEEKCGMTPLGRDASKQGLLYFEKP